MRTFLLILTVVAVALFATNPTMNHFESFVEKHSEELVLEKTGDSALGRALSGVASGLVASQIERVTERENYWVASEYVIDLDGERDEGEEWRFLGIGGQFIELDRPESLKQ